MTILPWALSGVFAIAWLLTFLWGRDLAKEHYSAIHYLMFLFFHPDIYEEQRLGLFTQIKKSKRDTPRELSVAMFSGLATHAVKYFNENGSSENQEGLWKIYTSYD
jgi:hypothetical protein